jgi:polysaccharide export outer membrane protein
VSQCRSPVYADSPDHTGKSGGTAPGRIALALVLFGGLAATVPARAEYRVSPGDVVEIFVARAPELQRRVAVKLDGSISFPLLGTMSVVGMSPSQMQARIQSTLATKVFRQRTSDGREIEIQIDSDEVTATIVEYRPIYVNGDVSKPGEYAYRPFMTVRQAVALSGGYDLLRGRQNNPFFESADLKGDYEALWTELIKEQAHVWRIKSELGDRDIADPKVAANVPVSRATIAQIAKVEADHLKMRQADYERQKNFLQRSIKQGDDQLNVLLEQQQKEEQGVRADAEDLQKVLELYGKGALPSPRVTDARRAVLLSATRKLQTTSQFMQIKRQQDDLVRQMERLEDQRQIELLRELQEANGKISTLQAKLQSVAEKLQMSSARLRIISSHDVQVEMSVIRKTDTGRERLAVDEEYELQPGDVVEIGLRADYTSATLQ